jgi:hypothetical protein
MEEASGEARHRTLLASGEARHRTLLASGKLATVLSSRAYGVHTSRVGNQMTQKNGNLFLKSLISRPPLSI